VQQWRKRDPILRLEKLLVSKKLITEKDVERVKAEALEEAREQFMEVEGLPDPSLEDGYRYMFEKMPSQLHQQLNHRLELTQE
jgi:TPP-dependent pyruvate/acetoin dehydrogenase alpha subunit